MKVVVKVRFNASSEKFESFGSNRYLAYLPFEEDGDSIPILSGILSRKMGVPLQRVEFIGINSNKDWVFDMSRYLTSILSIQKSRTNHTFKVW